MRLVALGAEPVGVVAIGQQATGVIAIGQLATGVIAIGQLARGAVVVGQLGLGLLSVGQLSVGVLWSGGMVGVGATAGPGLIAGLFGRLYLSRLRHRGERSPLFVARMTRTRVLVATIVLAVLAALWWFAAGQWLLDAMTRTGGIFVDAPPPLPCEPLC